jgi:hypothetical protein
MAMPHLGPLFQECHTPMMLPPTQGVSLHKIFLILSVWMEDMGSVSLKMLLDHFDKDPYYGNWTLTSFLKYLYRTRIVDNKVVQLWINLSHTI